MSLRTEPAPSRALPAARPRWLAAVLVTVAVPLVLLTPRLLARATGTPDLGPDGLVLGGRAAGIVIGLLAATAVALLVVGLLPRPRWAYPEEGTRDLRIDTLRGVAIVFVVLNHLAMPSLFQLLTQEAIGPVSGAEIFVALSGIVVGLVYRDRLQRSDLLAVTAALTRRALTLYLTALVVLLGVYVLTLLPGVDGRVITTYTNPVTHDSFELYPNIGRLLDYPVPGWILRDIVLLRLGPYQFNILGLYVVLLAVAPVMVAALQRRLVAVLLVLSWLLYLSHAVAPASLFQAQFESPFPLLVWQLLFVHGVAAGWYQRELLAWSRTAAGRVLVVGAVLLQAAMMVFSWSNPFLSNRWDVRLALVPDATWNAFDGQWFNRTDLGLGRVLATLVLLVSAYALLSAFWAPLHRLLGWFLVPLGQATLYVFVVHIVVALVLANVPGLDQGNVLLNSAAHLGILALLWLMVRHRVLFEIIPR
jgi:hypothetical protein